jgi:hypothetical protein
MPSCWDVCKAAVLLLVAARHAWSVPILDEATQLQDISFVMLMPSSSVITRCEEDNAMCSRLQMAWKAFRQFWNDVNDNIPGGRLHELVCPSLSEVDKEQNHVADEAVEVEARRLLHCMEVSQQDALVFAADFTPMIATWFPGRRGDDSRPGWWSLYAGPMMPLDATHPILKHILTTLAEERDSKAHVAKKVGFSTAADGALSLEAPLAATQHGYVFRHMRKAGGTSIKRYLDEHCSNVLSHSSNVLAHSTPPLNMEWQPLKYYDSAPARVGITSFRDPLARILSSYLFEGESRPCRWGSHLSECVRRYEEMQPLNNFGSFIDVSRQHRRRAFRAQFFPYPPYGRLYIANYYIKTLLAHWDHDCGDVWEEVTQCHVEEALAVVARWFPCHIVFAGGQKVQVAQKCLDLGCDSNAWHLGKWSSEGNTHEANTEFDLIMQSLTRALTQDIKVSLPEVVQSIVDENEADIALFTRLRDQPLDHWLPTLAPSGSHRGPAPTKSKKAAKRKKKRKKRKSGGKPVL